MYAFARKKGRIGVDFATLPMKRRISRKREVKEGMI